MFDKQEISVLKGMFKDQKIEMRDELHATEARLHSKIDQIRADVTDVLDRAVLPQISDLEHRVIRLERRAKLA